MNPILIFLTFQLFIVWIKVKKSFQQIAIFHFYIIEIFVKWMLF